MSVFFLILLHKSGPITKKGNKTLRTLLYLAVTSNIRNGKANPILDFYNKKRQQACPMAYRAAVIACANKLLRTLFSMHRSGKRFVSSSQLQHTVFPPVGLPFFKNTNKATKKDFKKRLTSFI